MITTWGWWFYGRSLTYTVMRNGSAAKIVRYKTKLDDEHVFEFFASLNRDLDDVRGQILSQQPLRTTGEMFSKVCREGQCRGVMMVDGTSSTTVRASSGFVTRGDRKWLSSFVERDGTHGSNEPMSLGLKDGPN